MTNSLLGSASRLSRHAIRAALLLSVVIALGVAMATHATGADEAKASGRSIGPGRTAPSVTFTTLHEFRGTPTDGACPLSALIPDSTGSLYGTTEDGGAYGPDVSGTIYKISPLGVEAVLVSFNFFASGAQPVGNVLLDSSDTLYGTLDTGTNYAEGAVFQLTATGNLNMLHTFTGRNLHGADPFGALLRDPKGNLYGTTFAGGYPDCVDAGVTSDCGIVYELKPSGHEIVLHAFTGGNDGGIPKAPWSLITLVTSTAPRL